MRTLTVAVDVHQRYRTVNAATCRVPWRQLDSAFSCVGLTPPGFFNLDRHAIAVATVSTCAVAMVAKPVVASNAGSCRAVAFPAATTAGPASQG